MDWPALIMDVVGVLLTLGALVYLFLNGDSSERRSPIVFLGFAYTVILVSNLYWIVYEIMTFESIYLFSAIDIASAGFFLLTGASIAMTVEDRDSFDAPAFLASGAFALAQGLLWILWTKAWFKDMLGCLPIWYTLYHLFRAVRSTAPFSHEEHIALVVVQVLVPVMQVWSYLSWDTYGSILDALSGIVCLVGFVWLVARMIRLWRTDDRAEATAACAFVALLWCLCTMYLMYEPLYSVFLLLSSVMMLVSSVALVRSVLNS